MYIKVYISGMEMSQKSNFNIKFYLKCWFFEKITQNHFFGSNFLGQANKNDFWVKNAQISGKSRRDTCLGTDFFLFLT